MDSEAFSRLYPGAEDTPDYKTVERRILEEDAPALFAEYRALRNVLRELLGIEEEHTDADKPEISPEELQELYEAVAEFAESYDIDSIDTLIRQAEEYSIPAGEEERFAQLTRYVRDSDWDGIKKVSG